MNKFLLTIFTTFIIMMHGFSQPLAYQIDSVSLQIIAFEGGPADFKFADINDDGFIDILSVGDHGSPFINTQQHGIMIYFGNGTGTNWNLIQNGNFGYGGVAVGDVNNDGFKDIGFGVHHNYSATDFGDQVLEVAIGDGTGMNWIPYDDSLGLHGQTWGMFGTDFADINNNGLLDIGSNSFGCCDGVHIYRNKGNGEWNRTFGFTGGNSNHMFRFGDINNDGFMDFAAARQGGTVYFGNGMGGFTLKDSGLPAGGLVGYNYIDLADVDLDATLEIAFTQNGGIFIYKWSELLQTWTNISGSLPSAGNYRTVTVYDMNNDGFQDVVAFGTGVMTIWTGDGTNNWVPAVALPVYNLTQARYVAIADVDFSGRPDILMFGTYPQGTFNSINRLKLFRESTAASAFNTYSLLPLQGSCYPNGAVRFIRWNSSVIPGFNTFINLELSVTGTQGPWDTIAYLIPNNGEFQWNVPAIINSSNCFIKYTLTDSTGISQFSSTLSPEFNIGCDSTTIIYELGIPDQEVFTVFPNPAATTINVHISGDILQPEWLVISDMAGREVKKLFLQGTTNHMVYDISEVPSGVYIISSDNSANKIKWTKL